MAKVYWRMGSKGVIVSAIQTAINAANPGGKALAVDGDFGALTDAAVRAIQTRKKLAVDGVVGPVTAAALGIADKLYPPPAPGAAFVDGWYTGATHRIPAYGGRVGGAIEAKATVVHTTDMMPDTFRALIKQWATSGGNGACAHFVLGRRPPTTEELMAEGAYPGGGLVQMVPINRNGNHAGGIPRGGYYVDAQGTRFHPNMYAVGIEIHAAGHLSKVGGKYIYEGSRIVPDEEVYTDATGRPWHLVTEYQFDVLGALLDALEAHMPRFLTVVGINPYGDHAKNGVPWASHKLFGPRLAGHATLDPINKTDPGPQVMEWLAKRYGKR